MADEIIAVIGGGAWGTSLAHVFASSNKKINLYVREKDIADEIKRTGENKTFLSNIKLNNNINIYNNPEEAVKSAQTILTVVPTQFIRETLKTFSPYINKNSFIVNCAKGIEISSQKLISEIVKEILPENPYAVLSGPTFAEEAAAEKPTAVTIASKNNRVEALANILSTKTFRPYISEDVVGVEISGAVKNVIAIACGMVEGRGLGNNAKAAVIARGMAETKRLGLKLGAEAETFLGLSGIGDMTLTCNSQQSRNFSLGYALGQGKSVEEILNGRKTVAEGYYTSKAVVALAKKLGIAVPISEAVYMITYNNISVEEMEKELMSRSLKSERL